MTEITDEVERAIKAADIRQAISELRRDFAAVIQELEALLAHVEAGGPF